jgi:serine phosphatase RsbU (regulator of sigma subunit)
MGGPGYQFEDETKGSPHKFDKRGKLAMALGDVSGKGTAAALFGSLAIGTLRELTMSSTCNPACMLEKLNHRMHGARLDARFIAMLFAVYDAEARRRNLLHRAAAQIAGRSSRSRA